jgi:hypothetical protein
MGREDEIRMIAYCIWEGQNYCNGNEIENWLKAEEMWEQSQKGNPASKNTKARSKPKHKQSKNK